MLGPCRSIARGDHGRNCEYGRGGVQGCLGSIARGASKGHQRVDRIVGRLQGNARKQMLPELGNGNRLLHGHVDEAAHRRVVRECVVQGSLGIGVVGGLTVVNDGLDDRMAFEVG